MADRGLASWRGRPGWFHRFRILKTELLVLDGRPKEALALLDAPPGVATPDSPEFEAGYLYVRGYALAKLGRDAEAAALLEKARGIAAAARLVSLESTVLVRLGTVLFTQDRAYAGQCYTSALALANRARDPYLQARAQEALGYLRLNEARYDECAISSARALRTYQALHAEIRIASVSDNLGWCDYRLGNSEEAERLYAVAQQLFTKHRQWQALSVNLNDNGAAAVDRADWPAARSYYERVIDLAGKTNDLQTLAYGRTNLATVLIQMNDLDAAEALNREAQAMDAGRVDQDARLRMRLNACRIAAARGKLGEAEALCRSVANSGIQQPRLVIDADVLQAKLLEREGRPQDAERVLQKALDVLNDSRTELLRDESKLTYDARLIQTSRDYVDLLLRRNRPADALEIAESSRARLLSERSHAAATSPRAAAFQDLARRTGDVFLFYWIAPEQSHVWAISASGIAHCTLPPEASIRLLVDSYRRFIDGFGDPLSTAGPGRELYTALVGPVQQVVPAGSHVVIIPDGPLFDLNFESLPVPSATPHYWLQDVTLSVAPSLGLLLHPPPGSPPRPARLLLIGDALSTGAREDFPRLENAGKEIDGIRRQFPPGAAVVRSGAEATPDAYAGANPANFSLIHFAAHATANLESPLDSAVVMTPRAGNNKLYARDIRNCPIHAELVTLSACRSAGARTYAGEGLVGFAWAFLGAGARNVVAGLWEVDDRSTALLMEKMYRELERGAPPAAALRQAKLELAGTATAFRKPYYWAPFELFTVSLK